MDFQEPLKKQQDIGIAVCANMCLEWSYVMYLLQTQLNHVKQMGVTTIDDNTRV